MTTELTPREVRLERCYCPGQPHPDGDRFTLPAEMPTKAGLAMVAAFQRVGQHGDLGGAVIEAIMFNGGISSWNLVDKLGVTVPLTPDNVNTRVSWQKGGFELSTAISEQFLQDAAPLVSTASQSSSDESLPSGPTEASTSPRTPSSSKRRARTG